MNTPEINALETRFKATALMLMHLDLIDNDEIDTLITIAHESFDDAEYETSKKSLDLLDDVIVNLLEFEADEEQREHFES